MSARVRLSLRVKGGAEPGDNAGHINHSEGAVVRGHVWMSGVVLPLCLLAAFGAGPALGKVLNQVDVLAPLSPQAAKEGIKLASGRLHDPNQPVWVSYSVVAVSAADKPTGHLVLDAAPEGVAVPLTDSKVLFSPQNMAALPRGSTFATQLQQQVGERTPQQLQASLGNELAAAYQALLTGQGAMYGKTVVKVYPAPRKDEILLLASFDRGTDLQPVMISVAMGQGEVPAQHQDHFAKWSKGSAFNEKLVGALVAFAIAGVYLYRKLKA